MHISHINKLYEWRAHREIGEHFLDWIASHMGTPYEEIWDLYDRADWLVWLCHKLGVSDTLIHQAACEIVRSLLHLAPDYSVALLEVVTIAEDETAKSKDLMLARRTAGEIYAKTAKDYRVIPAALAHAAAGVTYHTYDGSYMAIFRCNDAAYATHAGRVGCKALADIVRARIPRPDWPKER